MILHGPPELIPSPRTKLAGNFHDNPLTCGSQKSRGDIFSHKTTLVQSSVSGLRIASQGFVCQSNDTFLELRALPLALPLRFCFALIATIVITFQVNVA